MIKNQIFVLATAGPAAYVPLALYATGPTFFRGTEAFFLSQRQATKAVLQLKSGHQFCFIIKW